MSSAGTDGPDEAEPEPAVGPQPLSSPGAAGTMAASLGRPPGPSPPGGRLGRPGGLQSAGLASEGCSLCWGEGCRAGRGVGSGCNGLTTP